MNEIELRTGDRVAYVPYHAEGNINHADVEYGIISLIKEFMPGDIPRFTYFVRFDKTVQLLGWEGTTGQGCKRDQLVKVDSARQD